MFEITIVGSEVVHLSRFFPTLYFFIIFIFLATFIVNLWNYTAEPQTPKAQLSAIRDVDQHI